MPLTVITGLSRYRVAQKMRDAVCRAARDGYTALLAVPGDVDAAAARDAVAASVQAGVRVATLDGVVQAEWALRGDGRLLARGLARDVLLARALVGTGVACEPGRGAVALLGILAERSSGATTTRVRGKDLPDRVVAAVRAYAASLEKHGMLERGEMCERLAQQPPPATIVAVDGFATLSPAFERILVAWAASGAQVLIAVPWEPDRPGTAASTALVERLVGIGASLDACVEHVLDGPPELDRVRRELFTDSAPGPAQGAVSFAVTEGDEAEARHIATVVADLMAGGASAGDIVVAFADVARHRSWIRRALDDAGIGADIQASIGARETAFGGALLAMRECIATGFPQETVSAVVRSRFSGVGEAQADAADAEWRRGRSARGRSLVRRFTALDGMLGELSSLSGDTIGTAGATRWKKLADAVLANGYGPVAPVPGRDAALDAAAHRAFCRLLQEAVGLGEGEVGPEELWRSFESERIQVPRSRLDEAVVLVTGIDEVPATGRRHVVLGGLAASEFPRQGSDEHLQGDSIARAAARLGIALDPLQHLREERRAFYLAVCAAGVTLSLVRRGSDDEGAPVRESVFWDEFLDLYRRPGDAVSAAVGVPITSVPGDAALSRGERRTTRGHVTDDAVLSDLAGMRELSPSEIETYLACPYKWYIERRVRAQAPDRTVDAALAGRLSHDALARFYREWWVMGHRRVTPATAGEAVAMATRIAEEVVAGAGRPDTLEGATLLSTIARSVEALIGRDASFLPGYAPEHVEWEFGRAAATPAVDLGGVLLIGRADRIDVGPEGIVVVDYKRTHAAPLAEIRRDRLVQLQLYAVAASRTMGLPVAGGLYRGLKERADRGFVVGEVCGSFKRTDVTDAEGVEGLLQGAVDTAVQAAGEMRQGRIQPTPSDSACAHCQAASFCGQAVS